MSDPIFVDPEDEELNALDHRMWRAPSGRPLAMVGLPGLQREQILQGDPSIWRYRAALPVRSENLVSLGEGRTPLIRSEFRGLGCRFKLEWFSPTGSFKDRGASVLISFLGQHGVTEVLEDSSGNGGAAIAAYGAAAGIRVKIVVPDSTSIAKVAQSIAYGAEVVRISGDRQASEDAAIAMASEVFYAGHNWHPMFLQGTKTLGYELWEDLGFNAPDNVIIPASAGSNLIGCYLAFTELHRAGEIDRLPRLFISQPANCAPVHAAFQAGADDFVNTDFAPTIAEGTAIQRPVRLPEMLAALRGTSGGTVAISEEEIISASFELAAKGLYVEPTAAHAAAGFAQLVSEGTITTDQETVVILTGSGNKATTFYSEHDQSR